MPSLDNITWDRLEQKSSIIYPCPEPDHPGEAVVFGKGFPTKSGRANLVPAEILPPAEVPDAEYPFVLMTGRQLEHWHTGAMTRRAGVLDSLEPGPTASLNPKTLARYGIAPGDLMRVTTRRGSIELTARADLDVQEGSVFIPFAYVEAAANILTNPQLDPYGKIPEYKYCAVKIERAHDPQSRARAQSQRDGRRPLVPMAPSRRRHPPCRRQIEPHGRRRQMFTHACGAADPRPHHRAPCARKSRT